MPNKDFIRCQAEVWEPPGYWHSHQCFNRAKFLAFRNPTEYKTPVCGIHANYEKRSGREITPISDAQNDVPNS